MEEVTKISEEAINRYFTTLSQFGYRKYSDVNKLIALLFIEEILKFDFSTFITEEDYKDIINALYCLSGNTCLIRFPEYENYDSLIHKTKLSIIPRISEDSILRMSELGIIREKA